MGSLQFIKKWCKSLKSLKRIYYSISMFFFRFGKNEKDILEMRIRILQQEKQNLIIENGNLRNILATLSTINTTNTETAQSTIRG